MEYAFDAGHYWEKISPTESRVDIDLDLGFDLQKNASVEEVRQEIFGALANQILPQIGKDAPTVASLHDREHINTDYDVAAVDFDVSSNSDEKWSEGSNGVNGVLNGKVSIALKSDQPISPADAFQIARTGIADNLAAHISTSYDRFVRGESAVRSATKAVAKERNGRVQNYTVRKAA